MRIKAIKKQKTAVRDDSGNLCNYKVELESGESGLVPYAVAKFWMRRKGINPNEN